MVLGVGAGIAAYKACELLRRLTEAGHQVRVVPTRDSLRFVGTATWAALSGQPAAVSVFHDVHEVPHVRLGQEADLVFAAPATADLLARAASGQADDLLTSVLLTARCPVVFAPAMHTEMWEHPATVANVRALRERGCLVLEPASGRLTGADTGPGRLPEPIELYRVALGNWSSGRQGYALARTAAARGAEVTLVSANVDLDDPAGTKVERVISARQLQSAVLAAAAGADAVVMAAAVADYRPEARSQEKIKKTGAGPEPLRLAENPDILRELAGQRRPGQVIAGFAAETDDILANGRAKLAAKGCDLLVVNRVGRGLAFGTDDNEAVVLAADGSATPVPRGPKEVLADVVWDLVAARLAGPAGQSPGR
ncbi:MAG: phosphopantothenoylcysteine decarboxylase [Actinobacteria bacterium 13_2_20CM_2_72_6]|nr:MAG: phosphopantothenoylcysteine decarboxylase [Actinobacteria bacterium 13_2_20CM_2_72_6]